uniref:WD_REPEATS_REGION domain-containing protein n=1 Tax=Elaeophora elaphi TaxID=1147741 RepID=A0A0R3RPV2_9BILA
MISNKRRRKKNLQELSSTPFDLKESVVTQNGKISIRHNENIPGSSLSPRYFLWHNIMGKSARSGLLKCDLQRHVIEKRIKHLRISWRQQIPFTSSLASGVHSMDMDPVDNRYLLCGAARGEISIVDLERPLSNDGRSRVEHIVSPCHAACLHGSLITCCQWYPQDTSTFVSSDRVGKVKVDEYFFDNEITEMHWCNAFVRNPLIAVANLTSNIIIIDPRTGDSSHNLRWSDERVSSVRWSLENGNILTSGSVRGKITVWDVRSSKSQLMTVTPSNRFSCHCKDSGAECISGLRFSKDGLYLVSLSLNHTFTVWRAHTMEVINHVWLPQEYTTKIAASVRFDICSDDGVLRTCTPVGDEVLILTLDKQDRENFRVLLVGHFQQVNACVYRQKYNQVISSGNDRMIHIWSPDMDEQLPDKQVEKVSKLQEDHWSDEEGAPGPSNA